MSDENEKQWREYSLENRSKIKELEELKSYLDKGGLIEQLILNIETMEKTWDQNIVDALTQVTVALDKRDERISELEASSASHTEALANGNDGLNKFFKNYNKEIAELRKDVKAWADGQRIGAKQLNELKERQDFLLDSELQAKETDYTIKEVLRELVSVFEMENMVETGLLEKLDGQTENRQTEGKDVLNRLYDFHFEDLKDSGGENLRLESTPVAIKSLVKEASIDSKPPEPKPGEHFIMRDDNTPNNPILRALFFGGDDEYIIDWKFRYKREYYDIVKREDLQWLYKRLDWAFLIEIDEGEGAEAERIKEEYNL